MIARQAQTFVSLIAGLDCIAPMASDLTAPPPPRPPQDPPKEPPPKTPTTEECLTFFTAAVTLCTCAQLAILCGLYEQIEIGTFK